jgi:beta-lactamase superfamily II metal-dependent hydrolase
MPATEFTFFPLGNADTLRIELKDGRTILIDYANMRNAADPDDLRCDLPDLLRKHLRKRGKDYFDVVCFTHLDNDHCCGASEFFWFNHAAKYQDESRIRIRELWVPAAAITETGAEDSARVIRQEARKRLLDGSGIRVFSRPESLRGWLAENGLTLESRAHLITDAGQDVPAFSTIDAGGAAFFVHCPFAWRTDDRGIEDRNQDSVALQARFAVDGEELYALLTADVDHETLSQIVQTTKRHGREDRLLWDLLKLPHHCSYLSLGPDMGVV